MTNEEIATDWRRHAECPYQWRDCPNQAGVLYTESTGKYVEVVPQGRRAWMKPIEEKADDIHYARAAREKIAADLAWELRLPVPPVLLARYRRSKELPVSLSLVMYPRQFAWEHVREPLLEASVAARLAALLPRCSGMLAFDTWIKQMDHGDHPHNIVWGYDPEQPLEGRLIFLDFAFSTGFDGSWAQDGWKRVRPAPFPPLIRASVDAQELDKTLCGIEALEERLIAEIVDRIPDFYLPREQAEVIKEGLLGRQNLIRGALSSMEGLDA